MRVNLSDGGHIENLGIYELLKRRCRVILAVDAEADPSMNLTSLITLQQYARIDMGIRIEMEWDKIRKATLGENSVEAESSSETSAAPHCAIGIIHYDDKSLADPASEKGLLIYIKSSITGDENDYIRDYKRRYPSYPHETTGDQFFSEEQFEVYRALGFHAAGGLFDRSGAVQGIGGGQAAFFNRVQSILLNDLGIDAKVRWT